MQHPAEFLEPLVNIMRVVIPTKKIEVVDKYSGSVHQNRLVEVLSGKIRKSDSEVTKYVVTRTRSDDLDSSSNIVDAVLRKNSASFKLELVMAAPRMTRVSNNCTIFSIIELLAKFFTRRMLTDDEYLAISVTHEFFINEAIDIANPTAQDRMLINMFKAINLLASKVITLRREMKGGRLTEAGLREMRLFNNSDQCNFQLLEQLSSFTCSLVTCCTRRAAGPGKYDYFVRLGMSHWETFKIQVGQLCYIATKLI